MNLFDTKNRNILKYSDFLKTRKKAEDAKHTEKGEADIVKNSMDGEVDGPKGYAVLDESLNETEGDYYIALNSLQKEFDKMVNKFTREPKSIWIDLGFRNKFCDIDGKILESFEENLDEKQKWSASVKTSWTPKEGIFTESAEKIAKYLKKESESLKQAMGRLNLYVNRAGKNLKKEDKNRLELAKTKLKNLY